MNQGQSGQYFGLGGSGQKNVQDATGQKTGDMAIRNDLQHLKQELNQRLGKELADCQRKLGIDVTDTKMQQHDLRVQVQVVDLSYIAPLLVAYDTRITSLDQMVDNLLDDLKEMEKKTHVLIDDNQFLRTQLEQKNEQLLHLYKNGSQEEGIQGAFNRLERDELQDRLRLMNDENQIYTSKVKELENRIFDLQNRVETYSRHEPGYVHEIHELQEQVKKLEIESDDLRIRKEVLENKLKNQIEVNAIQDEEKAEIAQRVSRTENESKVLRHQISSLRQALEQNTEGSSQQIAELNKDLDQYRAREREYFNKSVFMEREADQFKDENRRVRKELDQTKADLEQTLKMMENYENKILLLQKKDESLCRSQKEIRERFEMANLDKDKLLLKEQHFDQTLQSVLNKNREDIQDVKQQNDRTMEQVRARNKTLLEQRDEEISRLHEEETQLSIQVEKLTKDNKSLRNELNRIESSIRNDIESSHQQTDDLLRQITELTEKLQLTEQSNSEFQTQAQNEKLQFESHIKNTQNANADLRQALEQSRSQLTTAQNELSSLKAKIQQLTRTDQNLIEELQKTKKYNEQRLEGLQDEFAYKLKNIQTQLDEAVRREKASRERAVQLLQNYDQIEEKLKSEFSLRIQDLENQLLQTRNQNKALTQKLAQLKEQPEYSTLRR